jgi:hypothetical protein
LQLMQFNNPTSTKMKRRNMTTTDLTKSIDRSPLRLGFLLTTLVFALASFAFSPTARAVSPPPDGGYAGHNTAEGDDALLNLTTGEANTAIGFDALYGNVTGNSNTAVGHDALSGNFTGSANTAAGANALIFNDGSFNTAVGASALFSNDVGDENTAVGGSALADNTSGIANTAIGDTALLANTTGSNNTATGSEALGNNNGSDNTATGFEALVSNNTGSDNTAIGAEALSNTTGSSNIAIGESAGINLTTGSNNIYIANRGGVGDSNTIRIGKNGVHTRTFIQGISGATVAGGVGVIVGTNGKLGTIASSERFKDAVKPMDKASEAILAFKPVTFRYKKELDPEGIPQFGLVAEEVEKVNPDLVARDEQGKPYTVRYEAVNAMLLNEFLKEHRKVEQLTKDFESKLAEQQKQIEALTAGLQKVSAQLEASKPASQVVNNNQ